MIDTVPRPTGSPQDPDHGALTVRIPRVLIDRIKEIARREERSVNYVTARLLREALEKQERKR